MLMAMSRIKIVALGCATIASALTVGYFIQNRDGPAREAHRNNTPITAAPAQDQQEPLELAEITLTSALPSAPAETFIPIDVPKIPVQPVALSDTPIPDFPKEVAVPALSCEYTLSATPAAAAMVSLSLSAPCLINERFTVHHNGMMFTGVTDENGARDLMVPALSANPVFIVAFANGEGAVASTELTSFEYYQRVVVQWKGPSGLQIHAREFGAGYGEDGHVWADAARDHAYAAMGEGGFMTRLGQEDAVEALIAEIYTFPAGLAVREGSVALSVEAQVTAGNCGVDIEAQSLQFDDTGSLKAQDLTLAMPECGAVGDFLVLKNLLNDLKIARN